MTALDWPTRTAENMRFDVKASSDPLTSRVAVALVEHRQVVQDGDFQFSGLWVDGQAWTDPGTSLKVTAFIPAGTLTRGKLYDAWLQVAGVDETPEMFAGIVRGV